MTQAQENKPTPVPGSEAAHMTLGLDPRDLKYLEVYFPNKRAEVVRGRSIE